MKNYSVTDKGIEYIFAMSDEWNNLLNAISKIKGEQNNGTILNDYLEKIEKYLKPLPVSERVDIVKEIKSEMLELQGNGKSQRKLSSDWAIQKS